MKRALSLVIVLIMISITAFADGFSFSTITNNRQADNKISSDGVYIDFSNATDEELESAIESIKAEQRARLKTKISLTSTEISLIKGKTYKNQAEVVDVPEGLTASKIAWKSSDDKIASCQQGTIKGIKNGTAIITASSKLSDGTEITATCKVVVYTPIAAINVKTKNVTIGVGETITPSIDISPKDASSTKLLYESTDSSVATVNTDGAITGVGIGSATINISSTDGSNKSSSIAVKVSKKDDIGIKKTDQNGTSVTIVGYKETKGSSFAKPESGNTFILIELLIENNASEEVDISSVMSFRVYCDGYTCDFSFGATMNVSNQMDGSIAPGKKMKGQIAYEVPKNWKEIEVHVTPDFWGGDDLEFTIYHK